MSKQERKQAAYALNLCTVSVSQIVDYKDINILEQEYDAILNNLNGDVNGENADPSKALAQAALAYGMYTAYANSLDPNSNEGKEALKNANNPSLALSAGLTDSGFIEYMKEEQAQKDMEAYLAALEVIDTTATENPDAAKDLVETGFGSENQALNDLLTSMVGNGN